MGGNSGFKLLAVGMTVAVKASMKKRGVPDICRIGVLVFILIAPGACSLHGAIFATREAKDLVAQKNWSDAMIAVGSVVITNASFELSGRAVRYVEPYSPPFSGVSTNTVRFKADLENHTSQTIRGIVLEIVLTDVQSKVELLRKNVFVTVNLPAMSNQRLSRLYVDLEINNAIFALKPRWEFGLRFICQEPFLPPEPPKSWFGPADALAKLRPIDRWDRFEDLPYHEPSRKDAPQ
jgi:hypothetical protein